MIARVHLPKRGAPMPSSKFRRRRHDSETAMAETDISSEDEWAAGASHETAAE
jgi:hypothetical protein